MSVHLQAFELLCDLLLLFSQGSIGTNQQLQALVHLPSDSLRSEMASFLMEIIFNDSDDAELHGMIVVFQMSRWCMRLCWKKMLLCLQYWCTPTEITFS